MSLNFYLDGCREDFDTLTSEENWNDTQAIIFATMALGIGDLSEKNYPEFVARLTVWQKLRNLEYNFEHLKGMIGLRTNVAFETRAKWMRRIVGGEMDDIVFHAKRELEDA